MAHPYLALRPTRNGLVSHYVVAGSKNPLLLGMGNVKSGVSEKIQLQKGKWYTVDGFGNVTVSPVNVRTE